VESATLRQWLSGLPSLPDPVDPWNMCICPLTATLDMSLRTSGPECVSISNTPSLGRIINIICVYGKIALFY